MGDDTKTEFFVTIKEGTTQIKSRVVRVDISNLRNEIETSFTKLNLKNRIWIIKLFNAKYDEYEDVDFDEVNMLKKGGKLLVVLQPMPGNSTLNSPATPPPPPPRAPDNSPSSGCNVSAGVGR